MDTPDAVSETEARDVVVCRHEIKINNSVNTRHEAGNRLQEHARKFLLQEQRGSLVGADLRILQALLDSVGRVLSREYLLGRVWGYARADEIESRTVDVHVRRLRAKLGPEGAHITTLKGVGYRFEAE